MRIAFDIDDTSGDATTQIFAHFNKKLGKHHTIRSVVEMQASGQYDYSRDILEQLYGLTSSEVIDIFNSDTHIIAPKIEAYDKALQVARVAYEMGADLFYITARPEVFGQISMEWLRSNRFPKGELICDHKKDIVAKKIGINRFYEDNVPNIISLLKVGVPCVMVDALCNHKVELQGVQRVFWNDSIIGARQAMTLAV